MSTVAVPSRARVAIAILLVAAIAACGDVDRDEYRLSADDLAAVRQAHLAYRDGWRANDSAAVMASLTSDAVLLPHHGHPEVAGAQAIRDFWWPADTPPATVTVFDTRIEEVSGSGDVAYLRGTFTLSFEYEGQTYTNSGNFVEIMRREESGWLISHRMWNDPLPDAE